MLHEDTLRTIQTATARSEPTVLTMDEFRAIQRQAHRLRAEVTRDLFRNAFSWLFRRRAITLPAGRIDAVRGH